MVTGLSSAYCLYTVLPGVTAALPTPSWEHATSVRHARTLTTVRHASRQRELIATPSTVLLIQVSDHMRCASLILQTVQLTLTWGGPCIELLRVTICCDWLGLSDWYLHHVIPCEVHISSNGNILLVWLPRCNQDSVKRCVGLYGEIGLIVCYCSARTVVIVSWSPAHGCFLSGLKWEVL